MNLSVRHKRTLVTVLAAVVFLRLVFCLSACTNAHDASLRPAGESLGEVLSGPEGQTHPAGGISGSETSSESSVSKTAPAEQLSASAPVPSSVPSPTPAPTPTPVPEKPEGERIAEFALQFEGYNYVYGARSPEEGFDCSGLVYYVFKEFGYKLFRVAADQATMGEHVEYEDLLPGDILCFRGQWQNTIGHVGIYVGDGLFIHAMDSLHGVVLWHLDDWLEGRVMEARRLVGNLPKYTAEEIRQIEFEEEEAIAAQQKIEEYNKYLQSQLQSAEVPQEAPVPTPVPDNGNINHDDVTEKYRRQAAEEEAARQAEAAAQAAAAEAAAQQAAMEQAAAQQAAMEQAAAQQAAMEQAAAQQAAMEQAAAQQAAMEQAAAQQAAMEQAAQQAAMEPMAPEG